MNRRAFLTRTALAAPALLTLGALPAMAATSGSTFIEAPGLTASGTFDIPGFGPGGNGRMQLNLTNGPLVRAQFGPAAIDRIVTAGAGARIGIFYQGFNGQDDYVTRWSLTQAALGAAAATFTVDGGLSANASALIGGDQARGAGLAAMIISATSAGAILRQSTAGELRALVTPRPTPAGADFGLTVTIQAA